MSDEAHTIEIESIVLTGVELRYPGRLSGLIEAEVRRALRESDLWTSTGVANSETRVAVAVAGVVVRSVQGGSDGV